MHWGESASEVILTESPVTAEDDDEDDDVDEDYDDEDDADMLCVLQHQRSQRETSTCAS